MGDNNKNLKNPPAGTGAPISQTGVMTTALHALTTGGYGMSADAWRGVILNNGKRADQQYNEVVMHREAEKQYQQNYQVQRKQLIEDYATQINPDATEGYWRDVARKEAEKQVAMQEAQHQKDREQQIRMTAGRIDDNSFFSAMNGTELQAALKPYTERGTPEGGLLTEKSLPTDWLMSDKGKINQDFKMKVIQLADGDPSRYAEVAMGLAGEKVREHDGRPTWSKFIDERFEATQREGAVTGGGFAAAVVSGAARGLFSAANFVGATTYGTLESLVPRKGQKAGDAFLEGFGKSFGAGQEAFNKVVPEYNPSGLMQVSGDNWQESFGKDFGGAAHSMGIQSVKVIAEFGAPALVTGGGSTYAQNLLRKGAINLSERAALPGASKLAMRGAELLDTWVPGKVARYADNIINTTRYAGAPIFSSYFEQAMERGVGKKEDGSIDYGAVTTWAAKRSAANIMVESFFNPFAAAGRVGINRAARSFVEAAGDVAQATGRRAIAGKVLAETGKQALGGGIEEMAGSMADALQDYKESGAAARGEKFDMAKAMNGAIYEGMIGMIAEGGMHLTSRNAYQMDDAQGMALTEAMAGPERMGRALDRMVKREQLTPEKAEWMKTFAAELKPVFEEGKSKGMAEPIAARWAVNQARISMLSQKLSDGGFQNQTDQADILKSLKMAASESDLLEKGLSFRGQIIGAQEMEAMSADRATTPGSAAPLTTTQAAQVAEQSAYKVRTMTAEERALMAEDEGVKKAMAELKAQEAAGTVAPVDASPVVLAADGTIIDGRYRMAAALNSFYDADVAVPLTPADLAAVVNDQAAEQFAPAPEVETAPEEEEVKYNAEGKRILKPINNTVAPAPAPAAAPEAEADTITMETAGDVEFGFEGAQSTGDVEADQTARDAGTDAVAEYEATGNPVSGVLAFIRTHLYYNGQARSRIKNKGTKSREAITPEERLRTLAAGEVNIAPRLTKSQQKNLVRTLEMAFPQITRPVAEQLVASTFQEESLKYLANNKAFGNFRPVARQMYTAGSDLAEIMAFYDTHFAGTFSRERAEAHVKKMIDNGVEPAIDRAYKKAEKARKRATDAMYRSALQLLKRGIDSNMVPDLVAPDATLSPEEVSDALQRAGVEFARYQAEMGSEARRKEQLYKVQLRQMRTEANRLTARYGTGSGERVYRILSEAYAGTAMEDAMIRDVVRSAVLLARSTEARKDAAATAKGQDADRRLVRSQYKTAIRIATNLFGQNLLESDVEEYLNEYFPDTFSETEMDAILEKAESKVNVAAAEAALLESNPDASPIEEAVRRVKERIADFRKATREAEETLSIMRQAGRGEKFLIDFAAMIYGDRMGINFSRALAIRIAREGDLIEAQATTGDPKVRRQAIKDARDQVGDAVMEEVEAYVADRTGITPTQGATVSREVMKRYDGITQEDAESMVLAEQVRLQVPAALEKYAAMNKAEAERQAKLLVEKRAADARAEMARRAGELDGDPTADELLDDAFYEVEIAAQADATAAESEAETELAEAAAARRAELNAERAEARNESAEDAAAREASAAEDARIRKEDEAEIESIRADAAAAESNLSEQLAAEEALYAHADGVKPPPKRKKPAQKRTKTTPNRTEVISPADAAPAPVAPVAPESEPPIEVPAAGLAGVDADVVTAEAGVNAVWPPRAVALVSKALRRLFGDLNIRVRVLTGKEFGEAVGREEMASMGKGAFLRVGNQILINGDTATFSTLMHEAGHLWWSWAADNARPLWVRGNVIARKSAEFQMLNDIMGARRMGERAGDAEARLMKKYKTLLDNWTSELKGKKGRAEARTRVFRMWNSYADNWATEAYMAGDAEAVQAVEARMVNEIMAHAIEAEGDSTRSSTFMGWLADLWKKIGEAMGFKGMTAKEISALTLQEFAGKVSEELVSDGALTVETKAVVLTDEKQNEKWEFSDRVKLSKTGGRSSAPGVQEDEVDVAEATQGENTNDNTEDDTVEDLAPAAAAPDAGIVEAADETTPSESDLTDEEKEAQKYVDPKFSIRSISDAAAIIEVRFPRMMRTIKKTLGLLKGSTTVAPGFVANTKANAVARVLTDINDDVLEILQQKLREEGIGMRRDFVKTRKYLATSLKALFTEAESGKASPEILEMENMVNRLAAAQGYVEEGQVEMAVLIDLLYSGGNVAPEYREALGWVEKSKNKKDAFPNGIVGQFFESLRASINVRSVLAAIRKQEGANAASKYMEVVNTIVEKEPVAAEGEDHAEGSVRAALEELSFQITGTGRFKEVMAATPGADEATVVQQLLEEILASQDGSLSGKGGLDEDLLLAVHDLFSAVHFSNNSIGTMGEQFQMLGLRQLVNLFEETQLKKDGVRNKAETEAAQKAGDGRRNNESKDRKKTWKKLLEDKLSKAELKSLDYGNILAEESKELARQMHDANISIASNEANAIEAQAQAQARNDVMTEIINDLANRKLLSTTDYMVIMNTFDSEQNKLAKGSNKSNQNQYTSEDEFDFSLVRPAVSTPARVRSLKTIKNQAVRRMAALFKAGKVGDRNGGNILQAKEKAVGAQAVYHKRAGVLAIKAAKSIARYLYANKNVSREQLERVYSAALTGQVVKGTGQTARSILPAELQSINQQMADMLGAMQQEGVDSGVFIGKLADTLFNKKGQHLSRSYKLYTMKSRFFGLIKGFNPDANTAARAKALAGAKAWAMEGVFDPELARRVQALKDLNESIQVLTAADPANTSLAKLKADAAAEATAIEKRAEDVSEEFLRALVESGKSPDMSFQVSTGRQNLQEFSKKKDLPLWFREYIGENTASIDSFLLTAGKLSTMLARGKHLITHRDMGLQSGDVLPPDAVGVDLDVYRHITTADFDSSVPTEMTTHGALTGYYVKHDLYEALFTMDFTNPFWTEPLGLYSTGVAMVNYGKVVLSSLSQVVNFMSNRVLAMFNGTMTAMLRNPMATVHYFRDGNAYYKSKGKNYWSGIMEDAMLYGAAESTTMDAFAGLFNEFGKNKLLEKYMMDEGMAGLNQVVELLNNGQKAAALKKLSQYGKYGAEEVATLLVKTIPGTLFKLGDLIPKIFSFEVNRNAFVGYAFQGERNGDGEVKNFYDMDVKDQSYFNTMAAQHINTTMPGVSRMYPVSRYLAKKIPFVGNFAGFHGESIRCFFNAFSVMAGRNKHLMGLNHTTPLSGDEVFSAEADARIQDNVRGNMAAGVAVWGGLFQAIGMLVSMALYGDDDDETTNVGWMPGMLNDPRSFLWYEATHGNEGGRSIREALESKVPEYSKNNNLLYQLNGDGTMTYWDAKNTDPFSLFSTIGRGFLHGGVLDGTKNALVKVSEPVLGLNILSQTMIDAFIKNEDKDGRTLWIEGDENEANMIRMGGYMWEQMKPGDLKLSDKIVREMEAGSGFGEAVFEKLKQPFMGRRTDVNLQQDTQFKGINAAKEWRDVKSAMNREFRKAQSQEERDAIEARADRIHKKLTRKLADQIRDARILGLDDDRIETALDDSGADGEMAWGAANEEEIPNMEAPTFEEEEDQED